MEHRHLFTNLTPPFDPICERDRLHRVVACWREPAGIKFRTLQRQGLTPRTWSTETGRPRGGMLGDQYLSPGARPDGANHTAPDRARRPVVNAAGRGQQMMTGTRR